MTDEHRLAGKGQIPSVHRRWEEIVQDAIIEAIRSEPRLFVPKPDETLRLARHVSQMLVALEEGKPFPPGIVRGESSVPYSRLFSAIVRACKTVRARGVGPLSEDCSPVDEVIKEVLRGERVGPDEVVKDWCFKLVEAGEAWDEPTVADGEAHESLSDRIHALLKAKGPLTPGQVADQLSAKFKQVYTRLGQHEGKRFVRQGNLGRSTLWGAL